MKLDDTTPVAFPDRETWGKFYKKFCAIVNDDIPEDDDIPVYKPAVKQASKALIPSLRPR